MSGLKLRAFPSPLTPSAASEASCVSRGASIEGIGGQSLDAAELLLAIRHALSGCAAGLTPHDALVLLSGSGPRAEAAAHFYNADRWPHLLQPGDVVEETGLAEAQAPIVIEGES
jgi:hypothetical protein